MQYTIGIMSCPKIFNEMNDTLKINCPKILRDKSEQSHFSPGGLKLSLYQQNVYIVKGDIGCKMSQEEVTVTPPPGT